MSLDSLLQHYKVPEKRQRLYSGMSGLENPLDIFENARRLADRTAGSLANPLFDYIYHLSKSGIDDREVWNREALIAKWIDMLLMDIFRKSSIETFGGLIDVDVLHRAKDLLSPDGGMLILGFHGGFRALTIRFVKEYLRESVAIEGGGRKGPSAIDDAGAALFNAHRALRRGRQVFIAPDGPYGKSAGLINVMGVSVRIGEGAHFLAHDSKCATSWLNFGRDDERFTPIIRHGPVRNETESISEFTLRLSGFYGDCISECFLGDPRGLCLGGRWIECFKQMLLSQ